MRCPVCDYSTDGVQSLYFEGLSFPNGKPRNMKLDEHGNCNCDCFGTKDVIDDLATDMFFMNDTDYDGIEEYADDLKTAGV